MAGQSSRQSADPLRLHGHPKQMQIFGRAVDRINAVGLLAAAGLNAVGLVAIGGVNAIGIVAVGGLNSTSIVAIGGNAKSLLPVA